MQDLGSNAEGSMRPGVPRSPGELTRSGRPLLIARTSPAVSSMQPWGEHLDGAGDRGRRQA